jgi:hypothetical protein
MILVFANQNKEYSIYPFTTREIAEAQEHEHNLNKKLQLKALPPSWSKAEKYSVKG